MESVLHKNRTLTLFGESIKTLPVRRRRSCWRWPSVRRPYYWYIGSPGGHVESGDTIYDMIQFIKPVVRIVGTGWVGSIATHIYLAAEKRIAMLCQIPDSDSPALGGFGGDATDIWIHAQEILKPESGSTALSRNERVKASSV